MRDFLLRPAVRYSLAGVALLALVLGAVWMTRTPPVPSPSVSAEPDDSQSPVPAATRRRIDQWLAETKRNRYGDPLLPIIVAARRCSIPPPANTKTATCIFWKDTRN